MARYPDAKPILEAAARWKDDCLDGDGSILSDHRLWTLENLEHLDRYFVENLDAGEGTFWTKLKTQLAPAPPEAKQVAAEIFWIMYLMISEGSISAKTKRYQIKRVWEWSGEPLPEDPWALDEELLARGVAHPGTAFHTHRWREFRFMITALEDWKAYDRETRETLLSDPWEFADWLERREHAPARQMRHVLLFLLFPEHFERIATATHKRQIIRRFRKHWDEDPEEVDYRDRIALDREVLRIRERLEEEHEGEGRPDFYTSPVKEIWRNTEEDDDNEKGNGTVKPPKEKARAWLKDRFGDARIWMLSAGSGGRMWGEFRKEGIAAIGFDYLGDLTEYPEREAVHNAVSEHTGRENPNMDTLALWQFASEMKEGDIVLTKQGWSRLLGWGRVTGPYVHDPERGEYRHTRPVDWEEAGSWEIPGARRITPKTLTDFTPYPDWVMWAFLRMEGNGNGTVDPPNGVYTLDQAMADLFLTQEHFTGILDTLSRRKSVILQGPPGVGKTFIARRIAWRLIGRRDPARVQMIQFHQSYAYEDFIQGWRPNEKGGFVLRDGVFHRFCRRAEEEPDTPHVFVIDEINRGNLSRIFGELMMLIEADKRGPEHAIPLTYASGEATFFVPENVYILGLMNTADRSLAMVDYALRRRFGFIDLEPAFGQESFVSYLLEAGVDEALVTTIDERMAALNEVIREDRKNLGPGFEIGHSYFVPSGDEEAVDDTWYRGIVETQIAPLLREYWFDQSPRVDEHVTRLLG